MSRYYDSRGRTLDFGGFNSPTDIKALLLVLFALYTASFIPPLRSFVEALYLSPQMITKGLFWQLLTYAVAPDSSGVWFLLTMIILFLFGRDVFRMLGRRRFWHMLFGATLSASVVAMTVHGLMQLLGMRWSATPLITLHGSKILLTIMIAAFATMYPNATIRLFFILPIRAKSFLWIEIVLAFVFWFLPTFDLAGFLGVCAAVGATYALLTGGLKRSLRELSLRFQRWWIGLRLQRMKKRRGLRIVKPDEGGDPRRDPWVH